MTGTIWGLYKRDFILFMIMLVPCLFLIGVGTWEFFQQFKGGSSEKTKEG